MSVYAVVTYDVVDFKKYGEYLAGVVPLLQAQGVEVLAADPAPQAWEGPPRSMCVVLKFVSEAAARRWYEDPEYTPVKQLRLDATRNGSLLVAKQYEPPPA